ncbi:inactive tyrosine-protein kinase PEAK1-like [Polyodon spathula]|uniref:inactive tyrosine-protein kinase PEAK1-like n=1 Tax=Polyodon spathula TaxID=7913 RepID=UPI001B7E7A55|nr:inactive tyrosine-protein kinase PEAK1-like [Polyodon spathula]XP_041074027.1 inactive tyrosine-protein kinase PEAK1-like [Polyodon spathula]
MSACNTFTEHVWKPGECKNCFKPKSLHCLTRENLEKGLQQQQQHLPTSGRGGVGHLKPNTNHRGGGPVRSSTTAHFRPPVAKKPTIAVKPTMMLSSAPLDSEGNPGPLQTDGKTSSYMVWNHNGMNHKRPGGINNNEGEGEEEILPSSSNSNGLTEVLKEIAGLCSGSSSGSSSRNLFLGRISSCYKRSLERGLPASSCLAVGSSGTTREGNQKKVSLSGSAEVISTEGGLFCYPDFSSEGEEDEDESETEGGGEHESWDESDEELLSMEIRMRGQPRFANFRAATLSPVRFCGSKKWNTVPLRNCSLQRICAVDYDDSYDEILNGYPSEEANRGAILIPYSQDSMQSSCFFSNSESTTSPDSSSSLPEDSHTTSSSGSSASCLMPNIITSPKDTKPDYDSINDNRNATRSVTKSPALETHKAVLAIRLDDHDKDQKGNVGALNGSPLPRALPGQPVTISFSPGEEQAKPYRVVNLEKPAICKPYTVVDVSASMVSNKGQNQNGVSKTKASPTPTSTPTSPLGHPLTPTTAAAVKSVVLNTSQKKSSNIRYQEVWTSNTSPRQKIPRVELIGDSINSEKGGPTMPPRHCSHKSAPTSPTAGLSSSRTVPVKSSNLSEIKFNSYNNAGMPPFPIIIRDEPTYARSAKNAVKVPIVINPSAYDNLAVYKSFLGLGGELPQSKAGGGRVSSHTYEEIGSSESNPSSPTPDTSRKAVLEKVGGDDQKAGRIVQNIQELNTGNNTIATTTASIQGNSLCSPSKNLVTITPVRSQKPNDDSYLLKEGNTEQLPLVGTGTTHREKASTVLSQIVASIQPPQSPPESPTEQNKAFSAEDLYSLPPDATKEAPVRPKSLFSLADGSLSKTKNETTAKQIPVTPTIPKSEPAAPFPPPRSTSSPYHASNLLQRHFGNWAKPATCAGGASRPSEAELTPGGGEGRRTVAESAKPKRWISFKSFFRRRKDEEEQQKEKADREKGKLVGLDGTVIHMLPPPPVQRQHWFSEAKTDDPKQKPTIIFTYKPEPSGGVDLSKEPEEEAALQGSRESEHKSLEQPESKRDESPSTLLPKKMVSRLPGEQKEDDMPAVPQPCMAQREVPAREDPGSAAVTSALANEDSGSVEECDEEGSESPASSICSATYSNLGQSRANIIPLKHPRNPKGSDDTTIFRDLEGSDSGSKVTPPPLPKKKILRANTEPSSGGKDPPSLRHMGEVIPGGNNLSVANPLYDLDSTWETASQGSSLSSEARLLDHESGDSLERPLGTFSKGREKKGCRSTESLAVQDRPGRGGLPKPQRQALYKGIDNLDEVVGRIRGLHTDTLRKLSNKCEDRFMAGQKAHLRFGTDCWSDFRLTTGKPCCVAGDAIYYTASYAKDPLINYAIKICKSKVKETQQQFFHSLAVRQSLAVHFNIQQDCGHFLADVPVRLLPWEEARSPEEDDEGREEKKKTTETTTTNHQPQVLKPLQTGHSQTIGNSGKLCSRVVVITREVPYQTVADFVREGVTRHERNPDLYERQVCLLLLQLCSGLEHMKPHHVTHCDLRLENLLLAHCQPGNPWNFEVLEPNNNSSIGTSTSAINSACPARLIISNFSQAKQKRQMVDPDILCDQSRLAPEIITATQYKKCDEFQTGILIYEMLHQPNPFEECPELKEREYTQADLPPVPRRSLYSQGLQQLARLLLTANPTERILISEARACLQCLLWGPREDLFQSLNTKPGPSHREATLQNWLDLKRTLLMIKFAERSLDTDCGVSLEDWLCCQYLAFATTDLLGRIVKIMQLH